MPRTPTHHLPDRGRQVLCAVAQRFDILLFASKSFLNEFQVGLEGEQAAGELPQAFLLWREK